MSLWLNTFLDTNFCFTLKDGYLHRTLGAIASSLTGSIYHNRKLVGEKAEMNVNYIENV